MAILLSEDRVFDHIPADVKRPDDVPSPGRGGVTSDTYSNLKKITIAELQSRLTNVGLTVANHTDTLVVAAGEMFLAARILRSLRVYQEIADSLFADGNIILRSYFLETLGYAEDVSVGEVVLATEEGQESAQTPWLGNPNDLIDHFRDPMDNRSRTRK